MFLMPSRYEPCGLNQIYSLKYGTVPIVRAVGGLDDTIEDFNPETLQGTGFKFRDYSPSAMMEAILRPCGFTGIAPAWEKPDDPGNGRRFFLGPVCPGILRRIPGPNCPKKKS